MPAMEPHVIEVVDRLLLERGELDPVDCLLGLGLLQPDLAAAPRLGPGAIEAGLLVPVDTAAALLERAQKYASAQGLVPVNRRPEELPASSSRTHGARHRLMELCACTLRHSDDLHSQRDLFHDSAETATLHELRTALAEHSETAAKAALQRLRGLLADTQVSEDFAHLLEALGPSGGTPAERLHELDFDITPTALRCLGSRARTFLAPLWKRLGADISGAAFVPDAPNLHASYAYTRAQEWQAVAHSVESEPAWRAHAILVTRLAEARARQGQTDDARSLWVHLCWFHPDAAAPVLRRAPGDPVLARLWSRFEDADAELAIGDFPAWLLLADPRQSELVPADSAPDDSTGRAYAALHRVVVSRGEIDARRALHALRRDLLELYLAGRQFREI